MIRQAVVLAAGFGSRIRGDDADALPKPLHEVAGQPLLVRTIGTLAAAGIDRVYVVRGFMGDALVAAVAASPVVAGLDVTVRWIDNPDYQLANGVSVLCAGGAVDGPFVLSMADHVYDASVARLAAAADMARADLWLCVDRRVDDVYDIDDATKVRTDGDAIVDIGKQLADYDAIDCGVFAVGDALLACLREELDARGDCSLSDGVRRLAARGRARVVDVGDAFWQDVDTPDALARAERILRARGTA
ncbi:MAG: nucleotidyltransferase [Deltaproteobacteria bacterium]|nr:MAG: nucleotidyltransferase [Deltaproteobacteria bacterium]